MNHQPAAAQNGFSLVEIMIATMILTFGLLAMAASTGYVSKELHGSIFDTQRTHAKEQIVEQLRGTTYASVTSNTSGTAVGRFTMKWNVSVSGNVKGVQLITAGPGYVGGRAAQKTITDTMTFYLVSP